MTNYDPKKVLLNNKIRFNTKVFPKQTDPNKEEETLFCPETIFSRLYNMISGNPKKKYLCYKLTDTYEKLKIVDIEKRIPIGARSKNKFLSKSYITHVEPLEEKKELISFSGKFTKEEISLATPRLMERLDILSGDTICFSPILPRLNIDFYDFELYK